MRARGNDILDLTVIRHAETEKAILVSDDGDRKKAVWLPLSQVEVNPAPSHGAVIISLPEWLAMDKGLI